MPATQEWANQKEGGGREDRGRKQVSQQKASRGGVNQRYALVAEMDGTRRVRIERISRFR